jgi:hypothetical protein
MNLLVGAASGEILMKPLPKGFYFPHEYARSIAGRETETGDVKEWRGF